MRKYQLIALSIMLSLAFAAPATAQSNAANDQYDLAPCPDVQNILCTQSIRDGAEAMTEDSAKKAEAAGAVLSGGASGSGGDPGSGSDDDGSGSVSRGDSGPGAKNPEDARAADTIELPDTGGAPLLVLGAGVLLAGGGALIRKILP